MLPAQSGHRLRHTDITKDRLDNKSNAKVEHSKKVRVVTFFHIRLYAHPKTPGTLLSPPIPVTLRVHQSNAPRRHAFAIYNLLSGTLVHW